MSHKKHSKHAEKELQVIVEKNEGETCSCGNDESELCECDHSDCGCGCSCGCHDGRFQRRFHTRAEQIAELEAYLAELKLEVQAVEEHLADLRQ